MSQSQSRSFGDQIRDASDALPDPVRQAGEVVIVSVEDLFTDSGPQWAAAIAYYAMLSAFPLFLLAAAIASFFVDPQWAVNQLARMLGDVLPREDRLQGVVQDAIASRGQVGVLAFIGFLWTGTRVFATLIRALNIAFDADENYSFWKRILIELAIMLTIGMVFLLALSSGVLMGLLWDALQVLPAGQSFVRDLLTTIIKATLLLLAFFLLYWFVPRIQQHWHAAAAGAITATALFLIVSPLFQMYLRRFGSYNLIYGAFGLAVVLLIWAWITALIALFGGEIASHTQALVIDGKSADEVKRNHAERAPTTRD